MNSHANELDYVEYNFELESGHATSRITGKINLTMTKHTDCNFKKIKDKPEGWENMPINILRMSWNPADLDDDSDLIEVNYQARLCIKVPVAGKEAETINETGLFPKSLLTKDSVTKLTDISDFMIFNGETKDVYLKANGKSELDSYVLTSKELKKNGKPKKKSETIIEFKDSEDIHFLDQISIHIKQPMPMFFMVRLKLRVDRIIQ